MKRLAIFLFFLFLVSPRFWAQQPASGQITISTQPPVARFYVDGQLYTGAGTFLWPAGSKHIVQFLLDPPLPGQATGTIQATPDGSTQYSFGGWKDNAGLLQPGSDPVQTITADQRITSLTAQLTVAYKITLNYFNSPDPALPTCGSPGTIPAGQFRPGLVYVGGQCYWSSATFFAPAGPLVLNAIPFPGFTFLGWSVNLGVPNTYLTSANISGPLTIVPQFTPAKRVTFITAPLGLQVLVDRTPTPTRQTLDTVGPCPANETIPPAPPLGITPLCFGDFDFAPGSTHLTGATSPQYDVAGKLWVFDSWNKGGGQNTNYVTDSNLSSPETLAARFIAGARESFGTVPAGLKLTVDGRQSWPAYEFTWGLGSTHQVSAISQQTDSKGRKYTFRNWSNSGAAAQTVTVDQRAVDSGFSMSAIYDTLSRVVVQTSPAGLTLKVDGSSCPTPCTIDKPIGSPLQVSAPTSLPTGDGARLDFTGWSDGTNSDHTLTINADFTTLTASYTPSYRLASGSDPSGGANFQISPSTSDGFYALNTPVAVTVNPNGGFKFRRWGGDLSGVYPSGSLVMSAPRNIVAILDRIPYIPPAGIKNAAGDTPTGAVAPGSIISIFGQSLAPQLVAGRVNPLAQSIAGVTVTVGNRILPLLFVSPEQINAQAPSDLPDGDYTLAVHSDGQPDITGTFTVTRNAPGLFANIVNSQPYIVGLHEDGTPITADSPARSGEVVSVLGTGFGLYTAALIDGFPPPEPPPALAGTVEISAGDLKPAVIWSGAAPGYTGCTMTKFRISDAMPSASTLGLTVSVNGQTSNVVMLPIQ